jgi:hypothetical protein
MEEVNWESSISCLNCGERWNIPKGNAEEDDFLNCCPHCIPEAWDADSLNGQQGTA